MRPRRASMPVNSRSPNTVLGQVKNLRTRELPLARTAEAACHRVNIAGSKTCLRNDSDFDAFANAHRHFNGEFGGIELVRTSLPHNAFHPDSALFQLPPRISG